jgi:predicted lysophospholipase L1 biosynthesis ABC-type transport system permease subunit
MKIKDLQHGLTLFGLIAALFVLIVAALFAMKLIPAYVEYATAKNAIQAIARDRAQTSSAHEIRRAFESRAAVDDITAVKSADLEISKDAGEVVIAFAYRKEVPLFANLGVYIDFAANSKGQ